jgi:hypothetical protein
VRGSKPWILSRHFRYTLYKVQILSRSSNGYKMLASFNGLSTVQCEVLYYEVMEQRLWPAEYMILAISWESHWSADNRNKYNGLFRQDLNPWYTEHQEWVIIINHHYTEAIFFMFNMCRTADSHYWRKCLPCITIAWRKATRIPLC